MKLGKESTYRQQGSSREMVTRNWYSNFGSKQNPKKWWSFRVLREKKGEKRIPFWRARRDIRPVSRFYLQFLKRMGGLRGRGESLSLFLLPLAEHTQGREGMEGEKEILQNSPWYSLNRSQTLLKRYNDFDNEKHRKRLIKRRIYGVKR